MKKITAIYQTQGITPDILEITPSADAHLVG